MGMIDCSDIRDSKVVGLTVSSDWEQNVHSIDLVLRIVGNQEYRYTLSGVTRYSIYEDFCCEYISQVKLLYLESTVFLSLDPFDELSSAPDYENDCFWFEASAIERKVI
ncbi:hypothetical protein AB4393_14260 [Vibrio splendidus]